MHVVVNGLALLLCAGPTKPLLVAETNIAAIAGECVMYLIIVFAH